VHVVEALVDFNPNSLHKNLFICLVSYPVLYIST